MRVQLSRRRLLGTAGIAGAGALLGGACSSERPRAEPVSGDVDNDQFGYLPPPSPPPPGVQRFLTRDEMESLDALVGQILPGDATDPGAREAGVAVYIDTMLADYETFSQPTYHAGPFPTDDPANTEPLSGKAVLSDEELARYGFQSALTPQETYRNGLLALDEAAEQRFGAPFADLSAGDQRAIVSDLAGGNVATFDKPSAAAFFDRVRLDTIHGMFADPLYGGNREMAGWRLIGYPGAQRAWTPDELTHGPSTARRLQGLNDLHRSHPGRPGRDEPVQDAPGGPSTAPPPEEPR